MLFGDFLMFKANNAAASENHSKIKKINTEHSTV